MKEDKYYLELEGQGFYETVDRRSKDYREYKKWKATHLKKGYKELKESVANQLEGLGGKVNHHQKVRLIEIYNFAFNQNQKTTTSCSPCISKVVKNLRKYLEV